MLGFFEFKNYFPYLDVTYLAHFPAREASILFLSIFGVLNCPALFQGNKLQVDDDDDDDQLYLITLAYSTM